MGKWFGLWLSEDIAQAKAFLATLNPNGKMYQEMSKLIEQAEAEEATKNEDNK